MRFGPHIQPKRFRPLLFLAACLAPAGASAQIIEYAHLDAVGNVRAVTDQARQVIERHDYLPFGEECLTGPCASNPNAGAGQPRKFTGKERDAETGLDYFGARYYQAKWGRFTTGDPVLDQQAALVDPQRWNRYAYGRNNAFRFVDPDGRDSWDLAIGFGQGIAQVNAAQGRLSIFGAAAPLVGAALGGAQLAQDAPLLAYGVTHPGVVAQQYVQMSTSLNDADQRALGAAFGQGTAVAAATVAAGKAVSTVAGGLPNDALVVRGGLNLPESFIRGSGVTLDASGRLQGVSVQSGPGLSLAELSKGLPYKQVGCCTVGAVRAAGGQVTRSGTASNANHATLSGVTPADASKLFTPTVRNPNQ